MDETLSMNRPTRPESLLDSHLNVIRRMVEEDAGPADDARLSNRFDASLSLSAKRIAPLPSSELLAGLRALDEGGLSTLRDHVDRLQILVLEEATQLAKDRRRGQGPIGALEVIDAAKRYAPLVRFPQETSFWHRMAASVSALTLLSLVAALLFGVLGALAPGSLAADSSAYLDIAKIFVGFVVGSTTTNGLASGRR